MLHTKRKFNAHLVGKGYLEGFDLEFRGFPTVKSCPGMRVPVVIWQLSGKSQARLDYDEFMNIGDFTKEYLNVKLESITHMGWSETLPRDEMTVLIYISRELKPLAQLSLVDFNTLFHAYQKQHDFDTAILVNAAITANAQYEESELAKFERKQELMKINGFSEEEFEILCNNLTISRLINSKSENTL
ncbi:gamma-glutamylcyclotransferase family protein [Cohnella yongneupensis]|uniref:Gamma-glutamylcyclotransferase family protein n=1 Tax=Cohnella yongneupensis TaxID=425006 RepID=A0ABW0QV17_9BACL